MTETDQLTPPIPSDDEDYSLDAKNVSAILFAVETGNRDQLVDLLEDMHAADIADLLEQVNAYDRRRLIQLYDREFDGRSCRSLRKACARM